MPDADLLRNIPKVDILCSNPRFKGLSQYLLTNAVRAELNELRDSIVAGKIEILPDTDELCESILAKMQRAELFSLRPVVNGTGIILHTNLGRACLSKSAADNVMQTATAYSTLEYDVKTGERWNRHAHVESLICQLTGAESAMAVNNNAAAIFLTLSSFAQNREVILSRGELVEIGGSFRVPDILKQSGCVLREVGTTNKTRLEDYVRAIGAETAVLLKVHTSNYRVVGFTETVGLNDLVKIGLEYGVMVIEDLGSGLLLPLDQYGIYGEPNVIDSVASGADLITFSGDKLLGGPQAGFIVGKKTAVDKLKKHPLARVMRIDKLSLAALEGTLRIYLDHDRALKEVPVLAMLTSSKEELKAKAQRLLEKIPFLPANCARVLDVKGQVGGGSVPEQELDSYAVAITPSSISVDELNRRLCALDVPIVGRIARNCYLLDVRTLFEADFSLIALSLQHILAEDSNEI